MGIPCPCSHADDNRGPQATVKLNHLIESTSFEIHIARAFSLEQAADAHQAVEEHYLGKLALRPHESRNSRTTQSGELR